MSVKLRLQRKGRKKAPFYHIVVADSRSPRDGRFIEKIGTYNPLTVPATIELNRDAAYDWLMKGAQPTDTVRAILRFKGVLLKKHLQLGVNKGAITQEQADAKLSAWMEEKESRIKARQDATADKKREHQAAVDGKPKAKPKPPVVVAAPAAEEETAAAAAEENTEALSAAPEEALTDAESTAAAIAESSIPDVEHAAETPAEEPAETPVEDTPPAAEPEDAGAESTAGDTEEEKATTEENTSES